MSTYPLQAFDKLTDLVYVYRPKITQEETSPVSNNSGPNLIIFCSWVGAASKHIVKYTDSYARLYSHASILLIRSTATSLILRPDISPAYSVIQSYLTDIPLNSNPKSGIILHTFSNGGAGSAVWLANSLWEKRHIRLPLDCVICDCCPGKAHVLATASAITLSLPPNAIVRRIGWFVIFLMMVVFKIIIITLRTEDDVARLRRDLNNPEIFSSSTPRMYLYSKGDAMVRTEDVHEHAEISRQRGYKDVSEEVFERAPHCALLTEDSERYWRSIQALIAK